MNVESVENVESAESAYRGYLYRFSYLPWDMGRKNLLLIHSLKALSPSPQSFSQITAFAPLSTALDAKSWPSKFSPLMAIKRLPGVSFLVSVHTQSNFPSREVEELTAAAASLNVKGNI